MKKIAFVGLLALLILSGIALAGQSGEEKKGSSMRGVMREMMRGGAGGESGMGMMGGMEGMMGQMGKMMDQCITAHESMHKQSGHAQEGEKS